MFWLKLIYPLGFLANLQIIYFQSVKLDLNVIIFSKALLKNYISLIVFLLIVYENKFFYRFKSEKSIIESLYCKLHEVPGRPTASN